MPSKLCSPPSPPRHRSPFLLGRLRAPPTPPLPKLATSHIVQNSGTEQGHRQRDPRPPPPRRLREGSREGSRGGPCAPSPAPRPGTDRALPDPRLRPNQSAPASPSWARLLGQGRDGRTDGQPLTTPGHSSTAQPAPPLAAGLRGPPGAEHGTPETARVWSSHQELAP